MTPVPVTVGTTSCSDTITPNGVSALLRDEINSAASVQVIMINDGTTHSGSKKYVITISDGVHCCDCMIVPKLFHLFSSKFVWKFAIVSILQVTVTETMLSSQVVVLDMVPEMEYNSMIGRPTYFRIGSKRNLSPSSSQNGPPNKLVCGNDVRKLFQDACHEKDRPVTGVVSEVSLCDYCKMDSCDWVKYGDEIITYLNANYVGHFTDDKGNVVAEASENCALVTNRQLRYLAYAAFTSAKHGHLGKKKRIPLPDCVVSGIRDVYPDVDNEYVGFKPAEVNDK